MLKNAFKFCKQFTKYNCFFKRPLFYCTNQYVYTKNDTKISDLQFKEEIFEYFAFHYESLNENEITEIVNKLNDKVILTSEIKDMKMFMRNLIEIIQADKRSTEFMSTICNFFFKKSMEIKEIIQSDDINTQSSLRMNNNEYDMDFFNVWIGIANIMIENIDNVDSSTLKAIGFYLGEGRSENAEELWEKYKEHLRLKISEYDFNDRIELAVLFFKLKSDQQITNINDIIDELLENCNNYEINEENKEMLVQFNEIIKVYKDDFNLSEDILNFGDKLNSKLLE